MNEDIVAELSDNNNQPQLTNGDDAIHNSNDQIVTTSLPRSVRVTTPIWRDESWKRKLEQQKRNESTVTTLWNNTKEQLAGDDVAPTINGNNTNDDALLNAPNNEQEVTHTPQPPGVVTALDGEVLHIEKLDNLRIRDILSSNSNGDQHTYELVDSDVGVCVFEYAVEEMIAALDANGSDESSHPESDERIIQNSWGLDCEWRPSRLPGEHNPVATLQLSSLTRAFVVDVQALCQTKIQDTSTQLTATEKALSIALTKMFRNKRIRVLGFGIAQDITKLAASFPHMPCFREIHSVLDLHTVRRAVYPRAPKQYMSSLQKTVAICLKKRLDKTEQCSKWDVRPLRSSQLEYASLDAAVLPTLLRVMMTQSPTANEENGTFLMTRDHLQQSFRFTVLDDDAVYRTAMGGIKTSIGLRVVRQMWGSFKNAPILPEAIPLQDQQNLDLKSRQKPKEPKGKRGSRAKRNAIDLNVLTGDLQNLPKAGEVLDYTKESCIERVIQNQVLESLPEESYLRYNRRGGVIGIENAWLLFVNFGVGKVHHKYRNKFLLGGQQATFTVNPARYEDCELLQTLLASSNDNAGKFWSPTSSQKPVFLFIRGSTREKFTFCGECEYSAHTEHDDLVDLILQLKNFKELSQHGVDGKLSAYLSIVACQAKDDATQGSNLI